nr:hypothetical protein [Angustibacter aerolatus]
MTVDATTAATLGVIGGLLLGAGALLATRWSERTQQRVPEQPQPSAARRRVGAGGAALQRGRGRRGRLGAQGQPSAYAYGIVSGNELTHPEPAPGDPAGASRRRGARERARAGPRPARPRPARRARPGRAADGQQPAGARRGPHRGSAARGGAPRLRGERQPRA